MTTCWATPPPCSKRVLLPRRLPTRLCGKPGLGGRLKGLFLCYPSPFSILLFFSPTPFFLKTLLFCLLSLLPLLGVAQALPAYQLSTHILDISQGKPAPGVTVRLEKYEAASQTWQPVAEKQTDAAGRIGDFLPTAGTKAGHPGLYKLTFLTRPYFAARQQSSFYPYIDIVFELTDGAHYHVPITLSAFGYSTYRGS